MKSISKLVENKLINVPLRQSLNNIFILFFLIPILIISTLYFLFLRKSLQNWELNHVKQSLIQTELIFDKNISVVRNFSDRLYINKTLQQILEKQYDDIQQVYADYSNLLFLENYLENTYEVENFKIHINNNTLLDNSYIRKLRPEIEKQDWYKRAISMDGVPLWLFKKDSLTKESYLCLLRALKNSDNENIGVLEVNMNPSSMEDFLSSQIFETAIAYKNKVIIASKNIKNESYIGILNDKLSSDSLKNNKLVRIRFPDEKKGIFIKDYVPASSSLGFKIMYIIPIRYITKSIYEILFISVSIIFIVIFLSMMILVFLSHHIDDRVAKVRKGISQVVDNQFEISKSIGGNDEFEQIYNSLYQMSYKIKNLIDDNYKQSLEKEQLSARQNEISFKMLSTQINPHFLFNTLETIRMKSLAGGDREVATMLKLLASLLRYNLSIKGTPVPMIKELEAVQNYLNIQHSRFGERVSYDIVTMFDIQSINILPLLIQPIVENSFSHGLENRVSGGFIYILITNEIVKDQNNIIITVKDNGCGIDEKKVKELNDSLNQESNSDEEHTSIGLKNVHQRIKLFYGPEYGIKISSEFGEGTTVTITVKG